MDNSHSMDRENCTDLCTFVQLEEAERNRCMINMAVFNSLCPTHWQHEQLKKCVGCEFHNWIVNIFDVVRYKNINTIDRPKWLTEDTMRMLSPGPQYAMSIIFHEIWKTSRLHKTSLGGNFWGLCTLFHAQSSQKNPDGEKNLFLISLKSAC